MTEIRPAVSIFLYLAAACSVFAQHDHSHSRHVPARLNFADPDLHPYADLAGGRDGHRFTSAPENENRLYDFYAQQADYYMAGNSMPEVLPAFPGLDGGSYGHWGKDSRMDHSQDVWTKMNTGNVVGGIFDCGDHTINKGVAIRLFPNGRVHCLFDPETLQYRHIWEGRFIDFPTLRWGLMGLLAPAERPLLSSPPSFSWRTSENANPDFRYKGYNILNEEVAFRYRILNTDITDHPEGLPFEGQNVFARSLEIGPHNDALQLVLAERGEWSITGSDSEFSIATSTQSQQPLQFAVKSSASQAVLTVNPEGLLSLNIPASKETAQIKLYTLANPASHDALTAWMSQDPVKSLAPFASGGDRQWPIEIPLPARAYPSDQPYAIEDLPVPLGNPYFSPMFLTGLAFLPNGDALVSTFYGDVWKVTGLSAEQSRLTRWQRIATGLSQPLGIETIGQRIFTIGRDQVTELEDLNGDGEIDAYHCLNNQFSTSAGSHDFHTGLQKDAQGKLYFAAREVGAYQLFNDGTSLKPLASGIRNPNGLGVTAAGRVYTSPQEGQWTPASMIIEASEGGFYGFLKKESDPPIDPPLVYIPRGIDNSTGGLVSIDSPQFGPLDQKLLALSFGSARYALVLQDPWKNGAIVPLTGDFLSGIHRGRINPQDGQLYIVGSRGWATYAQHDGSFHRVRYTGSDFLDPIGFTVFKNGIRLNFNTKLDSHLATSAERYFAQQWNYKYTRGYGSPEYSIRHPQTFGHDHQKIRSIHLLQDQQSLFIEIPDLQPSMQWHLRLHLPFVNQREHRTQIFFTPSNLQEAFADAPKLAPIDPQMPTQLKALIQPIPVAAQPARSGAALSPGRPISLQAITGLAYSPSSIQVKAGERITLQLENTDQMPHNWVLVQEGSYHEVGTMADQLVADPTAAQRGYVPESADVLASVAILDPGETASITFQAPLSPGTYVFLCTYPGHWRAMRGSLIVY